MVTVRTPSAFEHGYLGLLLQPRYPPNGVTVGVIVFVGVSVIVGVCVMVGVTVGVGDAKFIGVDVGVRSTFQTFTSASERAALSKSCTLTYWPVWLTVNCVCGSACVGL